MCNPSMMGRWHGCSPTNGWMDDVPRGFHASVSAQLMMCAFAGGPAEPISRCHALGGTPITRIVALASRIHSTTCQSHCLRRQGQANRVLSVQYAQVTPSLLIRSCRRPPLCHCRPGSPPVCPPYSGHRHMCMYVDLSLDLDKRSP